MQFFAYEPAKREEWDQFVLSNPQAGLGHLSSQFLLADENTHTINRSILMYQDPMHLVGVLPLYEAKSLSLRAIKIRTLSSVAGPLFRPDMAASEHRALLDLLVDHVKSLASQLGVDRISITYPSIIDERLAIEHFGFLPLKKYGFTENNTLGTYLDLRSSDADLMASLENSCRNKVRKAERGEVQISAICSREDWLACDSLNEQTLGKLRHSPRTMEIVWDEFVARGYAHVFIAKHEGRQLAVEVIQTFRNCAYYWIAYNARPILVGGANNYLLWHSILYAKKLGMSFFLMGTYEFNEDAKTQGISDFKRSFGGTPYYVLGGTLLLKRMKHHSILLTSDVASRLFRMLKSWSGRFRK